MWLVVLVSLIVMLCVQLGTIIHVSTRQSDFEQTVLKLLREKHPKRQELLNDVSDYMAANLEPIWAGLHRTNENAYQTTKELQQMVLETQEALRVVRNLFEQHMKAGEGTNPSSSQTTLHISVPGIFNDTNPTIQIGDGQDVSELDA